MVDKPLTVKQKKFVKAYVATDGNGQEAAKQVYDVKTDGVARSIASENLTKPNVRFAIEQSLEKHQITMDAAIAPIAEGLKAEKVSISGQGDQAFAEVTPDHSIRLKASGMALKLMGADKEQITPASVHFHQHIEEKKNGYDF
jgi:phage terminase small subunit